MQNCWCERREILHKLRRLSNFAMKSSVFTVGMHTCYNGSTRSWVNSAVFLKFWKNPLLLSLVSFNFLYFFGSYFSVFLDSNHRSNTVLHRSNRCEAKAYFRRGLLPYSLPSYPHLLPFSSHLLPSSPQLLLSFQKESHAHVIFDLTV